MRFQYKIQKFQTDAVSSVVDVFLGQEAMKNKANEKFYRDLGSLGQSELFTEAESRGFSDVGVKNRPIFSGVKLLDNIQHIQAENNIKLSSSVDTSMGCVSLDVEMETGTGKTYVYIKTMFELNKKYGWKKFIVIVPSIAIREGVKKSFDTMEQHFMEQYGQKVRCFIYDSHNLTQLDAFAEDAGINVMIINTQAFAASLKEDGRSKEARIIYSERDEFGSRRPIDVISDTNPIIIMDEPQKMGGKTTLEAIKRFHPLFILNYSATHRVQHNLVYVLDAYDAFQQKLVKKIEVKAFEVKNLRAQDGYLYLEKIVVSPKEAPAARLEFEVKHGNRIAREIHKVGKGYNLFQGSNGLVQYKGVFVEDVDAVLGTVTVGGNMNVTLTVGDVVGNVAEADIRRIQIHETIESHFQKECELFQHNIKCLSLFFIDEVAKYRQYDEDGNELKGEYAQMFEQEYVQVWNEYRSLFTDDEPYQKYLQTQCVDATTAHCGYFSVDKKSGHMVNSKADKEGYANSDDAISAYDLILKNKERLLSFEEPTRFIFSHSALREGWDNPNVFQICTLKHSDNSVSKRQEVGRGMRLSVNQDGTRMDNDSLAGDVYSINVLTVIASESYKSFVEDLQKDIKDSMYERPANVSVEYFEGKLVKVGDVSEKITKEQAEGIWFYLVQNKYVDRKTKKITQQYKDDLKNGVLEPLDEDLQPLTDGVQKLIQGIFDEEVFKQMISEKPKATVQENKLNDNFEKKEFQELWRKINHKYAYTVKFDSEELIDKAVKAINDELRISKLIYEITTGEQGKDMMIAETGSQYNFKKKKTVTLDNAMACSVAYDVVGEVAKGAELTRRTAAKILQNIYAQKFDYFKVNPEEFIANVVRIIIEQKATMIVEHISYRISGEEPFKADIFAMKKSEQDFVQAFKANKHIQDYVFTDGIAENSVEKQFAEKLENSADVVVYAKLPRGFYIPTPVGKYSPDWAIAFRKGSTKHIYFVAETKGSMSNLDLRPIEKAKINCATTLFNKLKCAEDVRYHLVTTYDDLLNVMDGWY